jgi:hypothetical protein
MKQIELKDEQRTRCEVWTRVMGYHRPISAFNPGKRAEQAERVCYQEPKSPNHSIESADQALG